MLKISKENFFDGMDRVGPAASSAQKFFVVIFSHLFLFRFAYVCIPFEGESFQIFKYKMFEMPKPSRFLAIVKFLEFFAFFFFPLTDTFFFFHHHKRRSFVFILQLVLALRRKKTSTRNFQRKIL